MTTSPAAVEPGTFPMAILLWFRQDLRLHDHPALGWAIATG